jgi:hypothetical protein
MKIKQPKYEDPRLESAEKRVKMLEQWFKDGLRAEKLESQPAPWVKEGLKVLESGKKLTPEDIIRFDKEGGTDHPDPWFI